jgi:4-hydroxy-2-oxoheptanedioate aldolase
MRMSLNAPGETAPAMVAARARVLAATKKAGIAFLNQVNAKNIEQMIEEGVRVGAGANAALVDRARRHTKRRMPW